MLLCPFLLINKMETSVWFCAAFNNLKAGELKVHLLTIGRWKEMNKDWGEVSWCLQGKVGGWGGQSLICSSSTCHLLGEAASKKKNRGHLHFLICFVFSSSPIFLSYLPLCYQTADVWIGSVDFGRKAISFLRRRTICINLDNLLFKMTLTLRSPNWKSRLTSRLFS